MEFFRHGIAQVNETLDKRVQMTPHPTGGKSYCHRVFGGYQTNSGYYLDFGSCACSFDKPKTRL
jgi:hypothetical protein